MKMTDLFLAELEREAAITRRALERVPEGRYDWKPHPKSMALGSLATLCASMPSWVPMIVDENELDLNPPNGKKYEQPKLSTRRELVEAHDKNVAAARECLSKTTDDHLLTKWRMLVGGRELTVYLRLNDASVPEIYGPSADEGKF